MLVVSSTNHPYDIVGKIGIEHCREVCEVEKWCRCFKDNGIFTEIGCNIDGLRFDGRIDVDKEEEYDETGEISLFSFSLEDDNGVEWKRLLINFCPE